MRGLPLLGVYTGGMKTFLVPVDFSPVSDMIIDAAVSFARAFQGQVVLLHVIQPPIITSEYALPLEAAQATIQASEKSAANHFLAALEIFRQAGVTATSVIQQGPHRGPPVYAILEEATKRKADFIIMGSHGHGKLYDLLVGSTASGVLKGASCGVIVMPPADKLN